MSKISKTNSRDLNGADEGEMEIMAGAGFAVLNKKTTVEKLFRCVNGPVLTLSVHVDCLAGSRLKGGDMARCLCTTIYLKYGTGS